MANWEERFGSHVERLGEVLGHADRRGPLRAYATGLLLPGERKSLEPMAARVDPFRVGAAHQSLHHFVAKAGWLSVGVARQYCGQLGKRENCQVAVTLSVASEAASLPIAYRLYLPEAWAGDPTRRAE